MGIPLTHIAPERIVEAQETRDIAHLVAIFHGYLENRKHSARPSPPATSSPSSLASGSLRPTPSSSAAPTPVDRSVNRSVNRSAALGPLDVSGSVGLSMESLPEDWERPTPEPHTPQPARKGRAAPGTGARAAVRGSSSPAPGSAAASGSQDLAGAIGSILSARSPGAAAAARRLQERMAREDARSEDSPAEVDSDVDAASQHGASGAPAAPAERIGGAAPPADTSRVERAASRAREALGERPGGRPARASDDGGDVSGMSGASDAADAAPGPGSRPAAQPLRPRARQPPAAGGRKAEPARPAAAWTPTGRAKSRRGAEAVLGKEPRAKVVTPDGRRLGRDRGGIHSDAKPWRAPREGPAGGAPSAAATAAAAEPARAEPAAPASPRRGPGSPEWGSRWREEPRVRLERASAMLDEVRRRYVAAAGEAAAAPRPCNDSPEMRRAAGSIHAVPLPAFDPEAGDAAPAAPAAAGGGAPAYEHERQYGPRGLEPAGADALRGLRGAAVADLARASEALGVRLAPQLAARLAGLERVRGRGDPDEARRRRERERVAAEVRRVRLFRRHVGKVLGAGDRRAAWLEGRKQLLALRRARHTDTASRARRLRAEEERRDRMRALQLRLAGDEAAAMRQLFLDAVAGEREAAVLEGRRGGERARAAEREAEEGREAQRAVLASLLRALSQRAEETAARAEAARLDELRLGEAVRAERERARADRRAAEGTWARSRAEYAYTSDAHKQHGLAARALRKLVAA